MVGRAAAVSIFQVTLCARVRFAAGSLQRDIACADGGSAERAPGGGPRAIDDE
jgi:hypothetical protein